EDVGQLFGERFLVALVDANARQSRDLRDSLLVDRHRPRTLISGKAPPGRGGPPEGFRHGPGAGAGAVKIRRNLAPTLTRRKIGAGARVTLPPRRLLPIRFVFLPTQK